MFDPTTIDRPAQRIVKMRVKGALGKALEFATLGEASISGPATTAVSAPPTPSVREHPHRLPLARPRRPRRDGAVPARAGVCTMPR
jgi:hypothetical protein